MNPSASRSPWPTDKAVYVAYAPFNGMTAEAKKVTTTIPIVMAGSSHPVEAGLVASLARPGGNVMGMSWDSGPENEGKRLQVLKEAIPTATRVAFLAMKTDWGSEIGQTLRQVGRSLQIDLLHAEHTPTDYAGAFAAILRERSDAMFAAPNTPIYHNRALILDFARRNRLPDVYPMPELPHAGGLMAYGVSTVALYRRAAHVIDRILKGATPAELPVELPTIFELVINLKTARALGLTIPPSLLLRADQVIE